MESQSGTATGHLDLFDKLTTFLTTFGGVNWVVKKNTTSGFTVDGEVPEITLTVGVVVLREVGESPDGV